MPIEPGPGKPKSLSESLSELEKGTYAEIIEYGLPHDYSNYFLLLSFIPSENIDTLTPIPIFEVYVQENAAWTDEFKKLVLERVNKDKVREINALVGEFNLALPEIKKQKDASRAGGFYKRAKEIIERNL